MAHYEKRKGGWSVRWRDPDGTNKRRQCPDAATRDQLLREIEQAHAAGRRWEPHARRNPSVSEVIAEYLREERRRWRPNTYRSHDVSLSIFEAWLTGRSRRSHLGVEVLSRSLVGEFWDHCREDRKMGVATANLRVRSVERLWAWCFDHDEHGGVTPRPRKLQLPAQEGSVVRAPTWEEMDRVIGAHTVEWFRRFCILLRCTGLRRTQALSLRWEDVDPEAEWLTVRGELGKSRQERAGRTVPMAPVLARELAGWGVRQGFLVDWPGDRQRTTLTARRAWERADIDPQKWSGRTAHAFRKGFVSGLIGLGASREAVEYLVGHSMGLRGVYTDPLALPLREAVALVPELCVPGASRRVVPIRKTGERGR